MRLSEARAEKLFAVGRFAQAVGVSRGAIYAIEAGRWLPSLDTVKRMCEVLEIENPRDIEEFSAAIEKASHPKEVARERLAT